MGWSFRKRVKTEKNADPKPTPERDEIQARNLEFSAYLLEKARDQGLTGPNDVIPDEFIAEAAEEFFGDVNSPEAKAAVAYSQPGLASLRFRRRAWWRQFFSFTSSGCWRA